MRTKTVTSKVTVFVCVGVKINLAKLYRLKKNDQDNNKGCEIDVNLKNLLKNKCEALVFYQNAGIKSIGYLIILPDSLFRLVFFRKTF